jgi:hypothetical protein
MKRLAVAEDDTVPLLGLAVRALRYACANMMMYVCVREDHSEPHAKAHSVPLEQVH